MSQCVHDAAAVFLDPVRIITPQVGDVGQQVHESAHPFSAALWQVGHGKKRSLVRTHENIKWPAATAGQYLRNGHVKIVNVRALLPIYLDTHIIAVQQVSDFLVLE